MPRVEASADRYQYNTMRENTNEILNNDKEMEIDLAELMRQWFTHIKLVLLIAILCAVGTGLYTHYFVTPIYEATAKLYILSSEDSVLKLTDLQIGSYLAKDYVEVFKTWEVHEMVISKLNLPYTYKQMQSMLTVSNPSDTRILYITVRLPDAHEAMEIANEYATIATEFISQSLSTEEPNTLSLALEPTDPISPNMTRNTFIGFIFGLFLIVGIVTIRYLRDDKIRTTDDIWKSANLFVLAAVPSVGTNVVKKQKQKAA
jgi:capsular polysaccharide biosynthesis protein